MSYSHVQFEPMKHRRHIPQTFVMTLDAPDLMDYYWIYLTGVAATCMQMSWKHRISMGCFNWFSLELVTIDNEIGLVISFSCPPNAWHLAVGLNKSEVELMDTTMQLP